MHSVWGLVDALKHIEMFLVFKMRKQLKSVRVLECFPA